MPSNRRPQIYRASRAGMEAWLGVHITLISGLFVVVVAGTGVLALNSPFAC